MGEDVKTRRGELSDRARERHDALTAAIEGLERALAAAAAQRVKPWSERVATELEFVRAAIRAHVDDAEEPGGLFSEVQVAAPRLVRRVAELEEEHHLLVARATALAERLRADESVDFAALRRQAAGLLTALRGHRAAEADLVYEAFWTDIGAVD